MSLSILYRIWRAEPLRSYLWGLYPSTRLICKGFEVVIYSMCEQMSREGAAFCQPGGDPVGITCGVFENLPGSSKSRLGVYHPVCGHKCCDETLPVLCLSERFKLPAKGQLPGLLWTYITDDDTCASAKGSTLFLSCRKPGSAAPPDG